MWTANNVESSYQRNAAVVVLKANESLSAILKESGTILYSSCETLRPGKYYFLGLNPGGGNAGADKIYQSLGKLGTLTENAYLTGNWSSPPKHTYARGGHPYQLDFKFLFKSLGVDPSAVCATNLIFRRSTDERGSGYPELAKLCWPVHETILQIVQPEVIITFGVKTFEFVREQLGGESGQFSDSKSGFWSWQHSILADGKKLIGTRHPSRYAL